MTAIDLEQRRDQKEREAKAHAETTREWLALAQIAVPAVLRAAAAGNVTCREAVAAMAPLLAKRRAGR